MAYFRKTDIESREEEQRREALLMKRNEVELKYSLMVVLFIAPKISLSHLVGRCPGQLLWKLCMSPPVY